MMETYNTKEDLLELADAYKLAKESQEKGKWELARLAHEAAEKFDLKQFAKYTGENYDVLKNLSYIAGRYTVEEVSNCTVTLLFEHFIAAAKADNRLEWLEKAGNNAWSAARLRREMNPSKSVEKKEQITSPQATPVIPVENVKPKPSNSRTLEEIVEVLNWYMFNDRQYLEHAASNALIFISMLFGEERVIVFDEDTGKYGIE